MPLSKDYIRLEKLIKKYNRLKKEFWNLYDLRNEKFRYTDLLKKEHPERKARKDWERKNRFEETENLFYEVRSKLSKQRHKVFLTNYKKYIKLGKKQIEVIQYLRDNPQWKTIKEIAMAIKSSVSSVRNSVKTPTKREFIILKKEGRINKYRITELGKTFHRHKRPLNIGDEILLNYIAENRPISLSKLKKSYAWKNTSYERLLYQQLIRFKDRNIILTKKGAIYNEASKIML